MDNILLKGKIESYRYGIQGLNKEEWEYIKKNYQKGDSTNKFYKVYPSWMDAKYNHIMVDPVNMLWRPSTFNEFYGGGVVD